MDRSIEEWESIYNDMIKTSQEKFDIFNACECCDEHKKDRPVNIYSSLESSFKRPMKEKMGGEGDENTCCACPCRHLARWVCREGRYQQPCGRIG